MSQGLKNQGIAADVSWVGMFLGLGMLISPWHSAPNSGRARHAQRYLLLTHHEKNRLEFHFCFLLP